MQLIIYLNESDLTYIVEGTIKKLLRYTGESYGQGELTTYVQQQTKTALTYELQNFDFNTKVAGLLKSCLDDIINDVVRKEIERITKKTIRVMKDNGELRSTNH